MALKEFIENAWVLAIGSGIILIIFADLYQKIPIFSTFKKLALLPWVLYQKIINSTPSIELHNSSNVQTTEDINIRLRDQYNKTIEVEKLKYKSDKINSIEWIWEWKINPSTKKLEIINLTPLCPLVTCYNQQMSFLKDWMGTVKVYQCPNCNKKQEIKNITEVKDKIMRNAKQIATDNYEA